MGEMLMPSEAARSSSRNGVPGTSSPRMIASRNSSSAASAMVRWRIPARSAAIVRTDTFTLLITYQVRERIGRDDGSRAERTAQADEVQPLLRAPALAGQERGAALRRGARADRQRRPARLRHVRRDRALLLPEVRLLARPVRPLRSSRAANERHHLPDARPRAAVPQPGGARVPDRL